MAAIASFRTNKSCIKHFVPSCSSIHRRIHRRWRTSNVRIYYFIFYKIWNVTSYSHLSVRFFSLRIRFERMSHFVVPFSSGPVVFWQEGQQCSVQFLCFLLHLNTLAKRFFRILELINRCQKNSDEYGNDIIFRSVELLSLLTYQLNSIQDSVAFHGGVSCIISISFMLNYKVFFYNDLKIICIFRFVWKHTKYW